ncbi:uncharacterized protein TRIADDRAFT_20075 [Trichoplax adhaerens]|uniref:Uncharacterized protein n=1 Tax=Trichoplax adhaerens TaxID=10228 RepID=B3RHX8_TRIAD|nr:hypothetical protein TRIADDRAFT_20075 [Trichoplax adhaerens]EDV28938.1 hypothetical protein TRIADDRAFT_20075 [Trichoplax adhaerens]|eukprot:XP_002108140.1 hypothetical protein TRIADDRAFT_20075 [Trichoplax adhaerens]
MISLVLAIVSQNYIRPSVSNNDTSKCTSNINFTPSSNQDPARLASTSTNGELFPYSHTRLPQTIFPLHYEIYLHPNYAKLQTHGEIKINLSCVQATSFILIHAKDIDIQSVLITDFRQHPINVSKTLQNNYNDFYYIQMKESFQPDQNYNLEMTFISKISTEKLQGFYRASYRDMTGNNRYMYVTQFEAASARSAFPCFDEPGMKVTVSLTIVRPSGYQALSNMPIEDSIVLNTENNMVAVKFAKSVNMSTYLIAFAVVDYHYLERRQGSVHIRTWAPADKINYTEVALNASVKILPYYRKLFGIAYPLPKLDLIAVPDFSAGAMENWGLITFRETSLLYNPKVGTISNFERVVTTVAHELAHQWFGNLVTMRWWSDLWLNEGFASFVEYLGGNLAAPSLHILESLYMKEFIPAMQYDSYINSHPILQNVDRTTEIGALFDKISYSKGCCVLTMLQDYLNSTIFFNGLRKYLITYKYRNADSDDLWNSISSV